MTKTDFIELVVTELLTKKDIKITKPLAAEIINTSLDVITLALRQKEDVVLSGFGTFTTSYSRVRSRTYSNINNQPITKKSVPTFRPGARLKQEVDI